MFTNRWMINFKKDRKVRTRRSNMADIVTEQVRKMLQETDQKLILMVRG